MKSKGNVWIGIFNIIMYLNMEMALDGNFFNRYIHRRQFSNEQYISFCDDLGIKQHDVVQLKTPQANKKASR